MGRPPFLLMLSFIEIYPSLRKGLVGIFRVKFHVVYKLILNKQNCRDIYNGQHKMILPENCPKSPQSLQDIWLGKVDLMERSRSLPCISVPIFLSEHADWGLRELTECLYDVQIILCWRHLENKDKRIHGSLVSNISCLPCYYFAWVYLD